MIDPATVYPNDPSPSREKLHVETVILRRFAHELQLFALCRRVRCFRERDCHGEPRECLARYAQMVPEGARDWVKATCEGQFEQHDFDTVRENYPDALEAMLDWRRAVARSLAPMAPARRENPPAAVPAAKTPASPAPQAPSPQVSSPVSPRIRAPWD